VDKEVGMSGVDAKTIVYVSLKDRGGAMSEEAGFHCSPGDPTRTVAMTSLVKLYEIAWAIKNEELDLQTARQRFFGKQINKAQNTM